MFLLFSGDFVLFFSHGNFVAHARSEGCVVSPPMAWGNCLSPDNDKDKDKNKNRRAHIT